MNIKGKMKRNISISYVYNFLMRLDITSAIWVLYLAFKGMSLVEIGILESIYHITGLLCEMPTGAIADLYGKKFSIIVGSNGCGKSTLLKIIMGIEGYEKGMLSIRKGSTIGYLEQRPIYSESFKVIDILNTAFDKVDELHKELKDLERQLLKGEEENLERLLDRYAQLQAAYESLGAYENERQIWQRHAPWYDPRGSGSSLSKNRGWFLYKISFYDLPNTD